MDGLRDATTGTIILPKSVEMHAALSDFSAVVRILIQYPSLSPGLHQFSYAAGNWLRSTKWCHLYSNRERVPTFIQEGGPHLSLFAPNIPFEAGVPILLEVRVLTAVVVEEQTKLCLFVPIAAFLSKKPDKISLSIEERPQKSSPHKVVSAVYSPGDLCTYQIQRIPLEKGGGYIATMRTMETPDIFTGIGIGSIGDDPQRPLVFPILVSLGEERIVVDNWFTDFHSMMPTWASALLPVLLVLIIFILQMN